jgi:D-alanyl-D-alanine carboxypeptidase
MTPSTALGIAIGTATLTLVAACSDSPEREPQAAESSSATQMPATADATTTAAVSAGEVTLGDFPEFPQGPLPDSVAVELQGLLDAAVDEGVIRGASAAVIVAEAGSWAGAAGVNPIEGGAPMTAASVLPTHSVGKTVIAAQTLRLVEEEKLGLDDLAADHIPPQFPSFSPSDLHDITIRELLGMRSGLIDGGSPSADPGPKPVYANVNYDLLAAIINHVTGRRLPELVHDDVLSGPGLDGLVIDAPEYVRWPHDGHMWADAATMARWGYELYGGFVLSEASLREMLDFDGEFYGLGAIDFTHPDASGRYSSPSVGHGGAGSSEVVRLVAFPDESVVVYLWATPRVGGDGFAVIRPLVEALRDAAQG